MTFIVYLLVTKIEDMTYPSNVNEDRVVIRVSFH